MKHKKSTIAVSIIICSAVIILLVLYFLGLRSEVTYVCTVCGMQRNVKTMLGITYYDTIHETERSLWYDLKGLKEHEHNWGPVCSFEQDWGGTQRNADSFDYALMPLDLLMKAEKITDKTEFEKLLPRFYALGSDPEKIEEFCDRCSNMLTLEKPSEERTDTAHTDQQKDTLDKKESPTTETDPASQDTAADNTDIKETKEEFNTLKNYVGELIGKNDYEQAIRLIDGYTGQHPDNVYSKDIQKLRSDIIENFTNRHTLYFYAVLGDQVSVYVVKEYIYMTGNIRRTAKIMRPFRHALHERIGKRSRPEPIPGKEFKDGAAREVDFTTPYEIITTGKGDHEIKEIRRIMTLDSRGRKIPRAVEITRTVKDQNFIQVKNIYTQEIKKYWQINMSDLVKIRSDLKDE